MTTVTEPIVSAVSIEAHAPHCRQDPLKPSPDQKSLSRTPAAEDQQQNRTNVDHLTFEEMFDWSVFLDLTVWRSGIYVCFLMMFYVLMSCGVTVWAIRIGGPVVSLNVGLGTFGTQTLLALSATATPGSQLNTMATWLTVGTRLCSVPRGIIYVFMQCVGAILGGAALRATCGHMVTEATKLGSWGYNEEVVTMGQAFCLEFFYSWAYAWLTLGVGLDPKQRKVFGNVLPGTGVAIALGLNIFVSGGLTTGFIGVGGNPGKYLGVAVASGNYQQHWIPWFAPLCASIVQCCLYWIASPYHEYVSPELEL
ncbi:hypothetical protein K493DRAFT_315074 [Basidiobolus meristosporus CBS 931.73]|uniref:Aquaporin-like protein n=1 Tax=Basidiobolus meristosporus CBS 931.73 TaxID=1314790 RepID=A0A1Y1YBH3_9FUNG|nr:hypothetical protein K493DRAFT_315074 [Basidiobolus meristosporus CBS 931.73]|eukprot:ORX95302.1 hypothetical protein K493DRAFT_315074 [Basidiobolus meristosporus CBS 931.73]